MITAEPVKAQVYTGMWIGLRPEVKARIAELFAIPKNGQVHVFDGRVVEDGYRNEDLARLNQQSIDQYLSTRGFHRTDAPDLFAAWNKLIELVEEDLKPKPVEAPKPKPQVNVSVDVHVDETGKVESVSAKQEGHVEKKQPKARNRASAKN